MKHGPRWWIFQTTARDNPEFPDGWWAVVDDNAGGVVAVAGEWEQAELIRRTLAAAG